MRVSNSCYFRHFHLPFTLFDCALKCHCHYSSLITKRFFKNRHRFANRRITLQTKLLGIPKISPKNHISVFPFPVFSPKIFLYSQHRLFSSGTNWFPKRKPNIPEISLRRLALPLNFPGSQRFFYSKSLVTKESQEIIQLPQLHFFVYIWSWI